MIVADGANSAAEKPGRALWNHSESGVYRHADTGYQDAIDCDNEHDLNLPMINSQDVKL